MSIDSFTLDEIYTIFGISSTNNRSTINIEQLDIKERELIDYTKQNVPILEDQNLKIQFIKQAKQKIISSLSSSLSLSSLSSSNNFHPLVEHQNTIPQYTYPSAIYSGQINPLKRRTYEMMINIDSTFRDNYYRTQSTNYQFQFSDPLINIIQLKLHNIQIPCSMNLIDRIYENNILQISVETESILINVPNGNYTSNSILEIINSQLQSSSSTVLQTIIFTIFSDSSTYYYANNRTCIGFSTNNTSTITIDFRNPKNNQQSLPFSLGWLLGFRNGYYEGRNNYVSEGFLDCFGPKYFYLVFEDNNINKPNQFNGYLSDSTIQKNIIAKIPKLISNSNLCLESSSSQIISYPIHHDHCIIREYFGPVNIRSALVQLIDEYGRIVNLNNMDFSFSCICTKLYDL